MENLNEVVAKNLIKYRSLAGLTQKALAKKINYTDKTISQWENGDRLPDLSVLVELSNLYKIKLDDFINTSSPEDEIIISKKYANKKQCLWAALSIGIILFVSSIMFFSLSMFESTYVIAYLSFIYAIPITGIVLLILSLIWWNTLTNILFTSLIDWGIILSLSLSIKSINVLHLIFCGLIFEILIVVFYFLLVKKSNPQNII